MPSSVNRLIVVSSPQLEQLYLMGMFMVQLVLFGLIADHARPWPVHERAASGFRTRRQECRRRI
jgi:hypothetical protein